MGVLVGRVVGNKGYYLRQLGYRLGLRAALRLDVCLNVFGFFVG